MKIEHAEVYGIRASFRGLRNPANSWDRSDSVFWAGDFNEGPAPESPNIGPDDLKLACKLIKAGPEHRKFLRQIQVWVDFTLPRYILTELDTYKVATVRNSCSTMYKLGLRELTQEDFELPIPTEWLDTLNDLGEQFREAKARRNTKEANIIRRRYKSLLPEGFLQKSTFSFNYETALTIYFQRRKHRLPEWREDNPGSICTFIKSLPYMTEFIEAKSK